LLRLTTGVEKLDVTPGVVRIARGRIPNPYALWTEQNTRYPKAPSMGWFARTDERRNRSGLLPVGEREKLQAETATLKQPDLAEEANGQQKRNFDFPVQIPNLL
jgi:hypothetical protein